MSEKWPETADEAVADDEDGAAAEPDAAGAAATDGAASTEHAEGDFEIPDGYGVLEGSPRGARRSVGIVVSRFNGAVTGKLLEGALEALDEAGVDPALEVLCDVRNPWELAASVFAPQKGADAKTVGRLERRLEELAEAAPRDPRGEPMTGAAGGMAGGLWAHREAKLRPGSAYVLDAIGFDDLMRAAPFVVTGEGRLDEQTLQGKIVGELATRCRQGGVSCHAVVGRAALDSFQIRMLDLASVTEAGTIEELEAAGRRLGTG
jgi:glycerate kinase